MSATGTDAKPAAAKTKPKKRPPKPPKPQPKGWEAFTEKGSVPGWVTTARVVMVLAFCATVPMLLGIDTGRRLFWAAMIAILPLFWVAGGYHLWRRMCPLAVTAQIPRYLGFGGKRTFKKTWLAERYFGLQMGLMLLALTLRLVATNGTAIALVIFLGVVIVAAVLTGALYTGKTWCNYICPVGMVEKFYTEPVGVASNHGAVQRTSQCSPCTACKKNCPDIDLEQGYWKELDQPARRWTYFMWPGVVFAFYFYYWLVAGNWDFYFSGEWTLQDQQAAGWLDQGLHFLAGLPVVAAAPLTLLLFGGLSAAAFAGIERLWHRRQRALDDAADPEAVSQAARHKSMALAGYVGFIIFYFYGGQPTIRQLPGWFGEIFAVIVVVAATAMYVRRIQRTEADFVKERFATKLLKRWNWGDKPERLQDVVLVHAEREQQQKARLAAYKETVREMVADGIVTAGELTILEGLRAQLGISDKEHDRVLGELSEEERQLFDPEYQGSVELRLQASQYRRELEIAAVAAARAGRRLRDEDLAPIRAEHAVGEDEERSLMEEILGEDGPIASLAVGEAAEMLTLAGAHLEASEGARGWVGAGRYAYLAFLTRWRAVQRLDSVLNLLTPLTTKDVLEPVLEQLQRQRGALVASPKPWAKLVTAMSGDGWPTAGSGVRSAVGAIASSARDEDTKSQGPDASLTPAFLPLLDDVSAHLRAGVMHALARRDDAEVVAGLIRGTDDESPLARETAYAALAARSLVDIELQTKGSKDSDPAVRAAAVRAKDAPTLSQMDPSAAILALTTLEKMALLRSSSLFERLEPHDLEQMTIITREELFERGKHLINEGEYTDDVFIVISGETEAYTGGGEGHPEVILGTSRAGTCIGEMAAFDSAKRSASVRAIENTRTLVLDGDDFRAMLGSRPEMSRSILELMVRRLRATIAATG